MTTRSWPERALALADQLRDSGAITTSEWHDAFARTPRHAFTPSVIDGRHVRDAQDSTWLDLVYSDTALLTRTALAADGQALPASSSSQPTIMAVMLELLKVESGMTILEIGTGTGYNAALLSHRLGDRNVTSVDIDPRLIESARTRLADLGQRPTLHAGDGADGFPDAGPFDRIVATCAIGHVPPPWITQLAPEGRIVAPMAGEGGPLLVLDKTEPDEVSGRFDRRPARFMPLRPTADDPLAAGETTEFTASGMPHTGTTTLDPTVLRDAPDALLLFCQLHAPGLRLIGSPPEGTGRGSVIAHARGALAEVPIDPQEAGVWSTTQRGTYRIWDTVETAVATWHAVGRPTADRLGVTALDRVDRQFVWLDDPDGTYSWPLVR